MPSPRFTTTRKVGNDVCLSFCRTRTGVPCALTTASPRRLGLLSRTIQNPSRKLHRSPRFRVWLRCRNLICKRFLVDYSQAVVSVRSSTRLQLIQGLLTPKLNLCMLTDNAVSAHCPRYQQMQRALMSSLKAASRPRKSALDHIM